MRSLKPFHVGDEVDLYTKTPDVDRTSMHTTVQARHRSQKGAKLGQVTEVDFPIDARRKLRAIDPAREASEVLGFDGCYSRCSSRSG
ncbi:hypothetical protein SAMN05216566_11845 [Aureimonas phyllosphaerae]|uniref:Acyl-CoA hydrolase n=1 Tax=Aureimonas phyllosphaerae TaxID=1166078 RepID=A0A7W6BYG8_9HYPH|nr:acyl-CoA hydrolase [Aureimonas phyllosphaerae]MBB3960810.1 acyl-CoA hydrolase [Aureimonas phyllosphaerae]SFF50021.1 hypothetical protein SAMN05216566_11845 [Aureimonas phyllosphaerae]